MPLPQTIDRTTDPCQLSQGWIISLELAQKLVQAVKLLPTPAWKIEIFSGYRTPERQRELEAEGRPTAPVGRSTHTSCPATGADIRVLSPSSVMPFGGLTQEEVAWLAWGNAAKRAGLRWGGGSPRNAVGIPTDPVHVDLGPRQ